MFADMTTLEVVKMLLPLIVVQFGLMVFSLLLIWTKGVKNLSPIVWSVIVVAVNLVGPILFFLFGRKKWSEN